MSWGAFYWRKNRKKMKIKKNFADFEQIFWKCFQNCTQHVRRGILSWFFWKLHFSRNFADSFSAMLSKKQSSCPEKELWKTKFENWSKVKQFFSDFDRKNVGRLVETALHVFRGTFWKLSPKNLISYKFVSTLSEKLLDFEQFFTYGCKSCILRVHRNVFRQGILEQKQIEKNCVFAVFQSEFNVR